MTAICTLENSDDIILLKAKQESVKIERVMWGEVKERLISESSGSNQFIHHFPRDKEKLPFTSSKLEKGFARDLVSCHRLNFIDANCTASLATMDIEIKKSTSDSYSLETAWGVSALTSQCRWHTFTWQQRLNSLFLKNLVFFCVKKTKPVDSKIRNAQETTVSLVALMYEGHNIWTTDCNVNVAQNELVVLTETGPNKNHSFVSLARHKYGCTTWGLLWAFSFITKTGHTTRFSCMVNNSLLPDSALFCASVPG